MSTGSITLSDDQKSKIIGRSQEAQHFIGSPLYNELKDWITQEKSQVMADIAFDRRGPGEENLTREQFVERRSAYWLMIETPLAVISNWASQEAQLTSALESVKKDNG